MSDLLKKIEVKIHTFSMLKIDVWYLPKNWAVWGRSCDVFEKNKVSKKTVLGGIDRGYSILSKKLIKKM